MSMLAKVFTAFLWGMLLIAVFLLGLNLYGLTQSIRKPDLHNTPQELLRFYPDTLISYEESLAQIDRLAEIDNTDQLVSKANAIVNDSLMHVEWKKVDPVAYRQLIPPWENYFLYVLGLVSSEPQIQRYHYANYKRSIKRGIGVCGDAAIVLSSILDRYGISNRLLSFTSGHVVVAYHSHDGAEYLVDPDFGVEMYVSLDELVKKPEIIRSTYAHRGYTEKEINVLTRVYGSGYLVFDDTYHFMTKRYIFEEASYYLKWPLPLFMLAVALFGLLKLRTVRNHAQAE